MRHQLAGSLMDRLHRSAGELELTARLERDCAAAGHVRKADNVRPIHDRLPAEQMLHTDQQRADRALALIGHRIAPARGEGELLMLGADAELRLRLVALLEPGDQFVARFDGLQVNDITSHLGIPAERGATINMAGAEGQSGGTQVRRAMDVVASSHCSMKSKWRR